MIPDASPFTISGHLRSSLLQKVAAPWQLHGMYVKCGVQKKHTSCKTWKGVGKSAENSGKTVNLQKIQWKKSVEQHDDHVLYYWKTLIFTDKPAIFAWYFIEKRLPWVYFINSQSGYINITFREKLDFLAPPPKKKKDADYVWFHNWLNIRKMMNLKSLVCCMTSVHWTNLLVWTGRSV